MTNSLLIGQVITQKLNSCTSLSSIKDKIFPIVAENGTTFPFVVYKRTSDNSNGCKDGYYEDVVTFEISVVSESYAEGLNVAQEIRKVLERPRVANDVMTLNDCHITNAYEDYIDNVYVQKINYTTKIN